MIAWVRAREVGFREVLELGRVPLEAISAKDHAKVGAVAAAHLVNLPLKRESVLEEPISGRELLVRDLGAEPLLLQDQFGVPCPPPLSRRPLVQCPTITRLWVNGLTVTS